MADNNVVISVIQNGRLSLCYHHLSNTCIKQLLRTFEVLVLLKASLREVIKIKVTQKSENSL